MKVIIAGSRTLTNYKFIKPFIDDCIKEFTDRGLEVTEIVCGDAYGIDKCGERWGKESNIPVIHFPAEWEKHGRKAGYLRNVEMAEYADAAIVIWDGESKGSKHMIDIAGKRGLLIAIRVVDLFAHRLFKE